MFVNSIKRLAFIGIFASLAVPQAFAAPTLNNNGNTGGTILSGNGKWSMTYYTPRLIPAVGNVAPGTSTSYVAAFNAWNATQGNAWNLNFMASNATLDVTLLDPTITNGGFGDLEFALAYTQGLGDPNPINGPWGPGDAVWSQSVSTNSPLAGALPSAATPGGPAGMVSYLDGRNGGGNPAPAYPFQYNGSSFYDDPSRQGVVGTTVVWQGDAMLSAINYKAKSIYVYADVFWGFQISNIPANAMMNGPLASDTGSSLTGVVNSVPEPSTYAVFGLGLLGLLVRRRRSKN